MSNMAYCRFRNTYSDLYDCYENLLEDLDSEEEERARDRLVNLCRKIVEEWEDNEN